MVRKCIVCKKSWNNENSRSFHRFPRDISGRRIWLDNLLLTEADVLKVKEALVCSDHFYLDDIYENSFGRHFLKFDAVPRNNTKSADISPERSLPRNSEQSNIHSPSSTLPASSFESGIKSPPSKRRKFNKPRYLADCHTSDMSSPTRAKAALKIAKGTLQKQRRKITLLRRQNRRLKSKISSLNTTLAHLKEKHYISSFAESVIEATLPGSAADVMKRILKGPSHEKYSPMLRTFALTLNFYSAKAYNFVRETFNDSLPHPRTLTKWYSTIEGKPGFTKESLRAIEAKIASSEKNVCVNLVIDEIHIMKKTEWTGKEVVGYINLGAKLESDCVPEATQALVFMIVAMNDFWKVPVGYFFIESLTGSEKANLLLECLKFLSKVTSVTFDGAAANITMVKSLGANIDDPSSLTTYILHPVTHEQVYLFLDPCHMLKLVRNTFGTAGNVLIDKDNHEIKWEYISKLIELQETEGLLAGTKLKKRHLEWFREKMRVRIAAQILSHSVASALRFLENDIKMPEFSGSEATAQFLLIFNDVFDVFNSKNFFVTYKFKQPVSEKNWQDLCKFFDFLCNYILNLKLNGQPVVSSGRKT